MKAMLIIDMPKSCKKCPLKYFDNGDDAYFGVVTERCVIDGSEISISGRYDDCPLKPLVRCKDCKYNVANMGEDPLDITDYTDIVCSYFMTDGMNPYDFCSKGEPNESSNSD